jgi:ribonucleoside-diphosphate reductase beta chain
VQQPLRNSIGCQFSFVEENEPILLDNIDRFVTYPIVYDKLWSKYEQSIANFWTVHEIDLRDDIRDWESLEEKERRFISHVLAFFAASDGIVIENLAAKFLVEVKLPEARHFYATQICMEAIHSETYSLFIDTLIRDPRERDSIFNAVHTMPAVQMKALWALKWINDTNSFSERLVAFACVEGILFSGSFAAIFWLKSRGKMPGLSLSNQLIARDEGLHFEFACQLYQLLDNKPNESRIKEIVTEAVDCEVEFLRSALPTGLIGINKESMQQYIQYVADRLLIELNCSKLYHADNPFSFMELISLQGKANFFERKVSEYRKARVLSNRNEDWAFTLDADF